MVFASTTGKSWKHFAEGDQNLFFQSGLILIVAHKDEE